MKAVLYFFPFLLYSLWGLGFGSPNYLLAPIQENSKVSFHFADRHRAHLSDELNWTENWKMHREGFL